MEGTRDKPIMANTPAAFKSWLDRAPPGSWCIYWLGRMMEENKGRPCEIGTLAYKAMEEGRVILAQRRDNHWCLSYMAVKRKRPRVRRARAVTGADPDKTARGRVPPVLYGDHLVPSSKGKR